MKKNPLEEYLEFMKEMAYLAGKKTLEYFQTGVKADYKEDDTPVTIADRKAEEIIRKRIVSKYPHHSILGEEFGFEEKGDSSHRWIIDPIDGTRSFISGVPLYGVLIGLEIEGTVEAGVAYFPALNEMLSAATGLGCWNNRNQVHVSETRSIKRSIVVYSAIANLMHYGRGEAWKRIQTATEFQAGWGDAYGYFLVATGRAEVMLDPIMNIWDCGPFPPILSEAGGYFGDWHGKRTIYGNESIATTEVLLEEVLELIRGQKS